MIDLVFKGVDAVVANILRASAEKRQRAGQRLYLYGEAIMTRSKRDFCPVDTGRLRSSGHVQLPEITRDEIVVRLSYGGAAATYAVIVHEDLTVHHPVGQAKYLERPVLEMAPGAAAFVAQGL